MPNRVAQASPRLQDGAYALPPQGTQPATAPPSWPPYKNFPMDAKEAAMHGAGLPTLPLGFHGGYRKPESHAAPLAANNDRSMQEISTLFLAGFPEDMTDREFSNMFLFAKGFEASMLKYPQPTKSEDDFRKTGERHGAYYPDRDGQHSPQQREPEQPSAKNKQIIGFAKFSTREEALQARDVLNGFRIDTERGCILKAELAKKNLHTKRSVPFVVTKYGHPAGHAKPALSTRDYSMGEPVAAPAHYAALSGRSGSYASHAPDMPSDDHAPMPPIGVHPMMDPRGSAAAWAEAMEQKHVQATMESHGMPTMTPISEMVGRLENFSKTIPTFAGQHAGAGPTMPENPTQWGRTNSPPVLLTSQQGATSHPERLRPNLTLTPLDVAHTLQNMGLGHGQGLHKSPESTMLHPIRDNSGSSTVDGTSSISGLTHANSGVMQTYQQSLISRAKEGLSRKSQKQVQQIEQFLQLCEKMPLKNNENSQSEPIDEETPDLEKLLERIRAKYRLLCKSLGFEEEGSASDGPAAMEAASTKAQKLVQIAGQLVDVNQLNSIDWAQVGRGNQNVAQMAYLCLGVNVVLSIAKGVAGYGSSSSSLLADAVHSLSDTISDLATILCLYKAKQLPTARYPFGYGKMETLGSFFISCMLLSGSISIGIHALSKMLERLAPVVPWLEQIRVLLYHIPEAPGHVHTHDHGPTMMEPRAILFVIMTLIIKEILYRAMRRTARKTRSTMLEASAQHQRSESSASIMSLLALSGSWAGYFWLDPLGGMAQAVHNGLDAWRLLCRSLGQLCDHCADPDVVQDIEAALKSAAAQAKESDQRPMFTWSDLTVVPSGPFLVVFVTLYFDQQVALKDAVATDEWLSERLSIRAPLRQS
ncbi:hypothetical protein MCAP1_000177 [Malassezia caprae]|uniref:RRM domain-containing protein n=1 Tax=Malassezia caprae TaxID=1381934 RepID=A0AAF0E4E3_9BASI|nr:hypothetical protein MCAP1_000177 [Malassezia caprae]